MPTPIFFNNRFLQLSLYPEQSCWDLKGVEGRQPKLSGARLRVTYRKGLRRYTLLNRWPGCQVSEGRTVNSAHGPMQEVSLVFDPDENLMQARLTFAMPAEEPLLFWRVSVRNQGKTPVNMDRLELLNLGFVQIASESWRGSAGQAMMQSGEQGRGAIHFPPPGGAKRQTGPELAFFSNGWQTWSYTGTYAAGDRYRNTRLGPIGAPMWYNATTPRPRRSNTFTSDLFGVLGDRASRSAMLVGFLSQREQFGSVETWLNPYDPALRLWASGDGARLEAGAEAGTDWACLGFLEMDDPGALSPYLEAVRRENTLDAEGLEATEEENIPAGWCSWYHFFQKVTAEDIRANLEAAASLGETLPLDLIQIDDGFEAQVGDWFAFSPRFPQGVAPLAAEIRQGGFTPGLWLAPFIVHPRSRLYAEHPEWLLRDRLGKPVNAGFVWNTFNAALDLTQPAALDYACRAVRTAVEEWGFSFLKLDFLYAAALPGQRRDPTRTRAQVLRLGLKALRQAAGPKTHLLGCGCPLGSGVGLINSMRIGPDVAPYWRPRWNGIEVGFRSEWALPAARNAIQNALTRAPLHGRWWINDPDCLLLRPETDLTLPEVQSLATVIGLSGGSLLFSDHLPSLPPERLRIAQAMLPLIGKAAWAVDWFDRATPALLRLDLEGAAGGWHLLAVFNWDDRERELVLRLEEARLEAEAMYYAREFWSGEVSLIKDGQCRLGKTPAHGTRLLALRKFEPGQPQYLGGDLHFSQGLEVSAWKAGEGHLEMRLERPGEAEGEISVSLPRPADEIRLNGEAIEARLVEGTVTHLPVRFARQAEIKIGWAQ